MSLTEDPREGCLCGTATRGPVRSVSSSAAPELRVSLAGPCGGDGDPVPAFTGTAVLTATITISEIRFDPHNAPCSSAEPKRAQVVVVFVPKVRAIWRVYNTLSHHHPVAVWIVLGYSKLADKLSICISACVSSEGCKGAVVGVRECPHHWIDGRLHVPMSRVSVHLRGVASWSRAGGMGRRSGRLVIFIHDKFLNYVLCIVCGPKRWPLPADLVYFGGKKEALGTPPFFLFRPVHRVRGGKVAIAS